MSLDAPRKTSRGWIWFYVILAVLVVVAISTLILFNLRQQLTPEQLAAARKLWGEKRPRDYVLSYVQKEETSKWFIVTVRAGKVASVVMEQQVGDQKVAQPLEQRQYQYYDMDGLFDSIERFLEMRSKPDSPRTFMTAVFDPKNGQLLHFVRSVTSAGKRVQIEVEPIKTEPAGRRAGSVSGAEDFVTPRVDTRPAPA
jgi:hypothetical protein